MATHNASLLTHPAAPSVDTSPVNRQKFWIIVSLLTVYIVWGTTYLASHIALESIPSYLLMGVRFVIAGTALLTLLVLSGSPLPTLKQWRNAGLAGGLILVGGTGSVALGQEHNVSSGLAATLIATVPLWTLIIGLFFRRIPSRMDWIGVGLGILGVAVLTLEGNLQANPIGVAIIIFAAASWSFGSVLSLHLDLPKGMMANAAEMLMAGVIFLVLSAVRGEVMHEAPTSSTILALIYLITFGALAGMSAYTYLLNHVSPLLATSYTFVNPVIALFLGVVLGGEVLTGSALVALPLILAGVGFVAYGKVKPTKVK